MTDTWRTFAACLEGLTAASATLNLAYFLTRISRGRLETAARVAAASALALVSLGALGESLLLLTSLTVLPAGSPPANAPWALVRALSFAGAGAISALILRRLLADRRSEG